MGEAHQGVLDIVLQHSDGLNHNITHLHTDAIGDGIVHFEDSPIRCIACWVNPPLELEPGITRGCGVEGDVIGVVGQQKHIEPVVTGILGQ